MRWYSCHWPSPVRSAIVYLLVVILATTPSAAIAARWAAAPAATPPSGNQAKPDEGARSDAELGYITAPAVVAARVRPRQLLTSPAFEMMPIEVFAALGQQHLGIEPAGITEVLAIVEPPVGGPPGAGLVVRFAAPFQLRDLAEQIREHTTQDELDGRPYLRSANPMLPSFFMPNDTTLIAATDGTLQRMLSTHAKQATTPLRKQLTALGTGNDLTAVVNLAPIRPMILAGMRNAPDVPPPWQPLLEVPELVEWVSLTFNATNAQRSQLVAIGADQRAAQRLAGVIDDGLKVWREGLLAALAKQRQSDDPAKRAAAAYADRISGALIEKYRPQREGDRLVLWTSEGKDRAEMTTIAAVGVLVALLLPAVQAAREAARRVQSMNNMKQLTLGMLNYESAYGSFPAPARCDDNGKPLLSWRVELLPFLEEQSLYDALHRDEPWDSPHNKRLITQMPAVFRGPNSTSTSRTCYLAPAGKGLLMDGKQGTKIATVRDGTSNTIALLEVDDDRAVVWTQPGDWQYNSKSPCEGLGHVRAGGFLAAMCDGSVRFISESIDLDAFKGLLTRAGGEARAAP